MLDWRGALAGQAALVGGGLAAWSWSRRRPPRSGQAGRSAAAQVLEAAHDVSCASRSLGMVCSCPSGAVAPTCRLMDLHACGDERLRFHLVTRPGTRKATQLRAASGVTITFHDPRDGGENGYAALSGRVRELTSAKERRARWKGSWSFFHPGGAEGDSIVWEFAPDRCEVINHRQRVAPSWRAATLLRRPTGTGEAGGVWAPAPAAEPAPAAPPRAAPAASRVECGAVQDARK